MVSLSRYVIMQVLLAAAFIVQQIVQILAPLVEIKYTLSIL